MEKKKIPQNIRAKGTTPLQVSEPEPIATFVAEPELEELEPEVLKFEPESEIVEPKKSSAFKRLRGILGGNK